MHRTEITRLNDIPNVGPATVRYLKVIGITRPEELIGQNPYAMYKALCNATQQRFDPCLADVFISSVKFMEGAPAKPWWAYTEERKANLSGTVLTT